MEDKLYPRSTEYFRHAAPEQQEDEKNAEKAAIMREYEIMGQIIKDFDEAIDFYKSNDAVPDDTELMKIHFTANKKMVNFLRIERDKMLSYLESVKQ